MRDLVGSEVEGAMTGQEEAAQVGPGTGKTEFLDLRVTWEETCRLGLMLESFEALGGQITLHQAVYFELLPAWLDHSLDEQPV